MEQTHQLLNKKVRIVLIGEKALSYNGVIESIDQDFVTIIDKFNSRVNINKSQISQIIEGGNGR